MACQALAEPFAASISLGDTSQPQTAFHLRRSRARKNPLRPSPKKLSTSPRDTLSHSKFGLTIKFEALGTHQSTSELSTMPSSTSSIDSGMRYTKTGRVSKAQKGLRGAHTCVCGKHYSRAEHLRRHQQNHETHLPCHFTSCGKIFHRQDLLDRHLATKHKEEPECSPHRQSQASCGSSYTQSGSVDNMTCTIAPVQALSTAELLPYVPEISDTFSSSSATIASHTESVKPEHSIPPVLGWHQTSPNFELAFDPIQPFSAPNGHSPVIPYPVLDPWVTVPDHYPYQTNLDQLSIPYIHTDISSPLSSSTARMATMLPGMDQGPFSTSGASSPASVVSTALPPVIIPQDSKGIPYPLSFPVQRDKYGSLILEVPLEDQQLGISLSLRTKQHYIESYWKYFHPMFPILHRPSYQAQTPCPLLSAAVMSIGAQYNDGHISKADSRVLHEKCQDLLSKDRLRLRSTDGISYMQAVFLVEMFSHFKAKRSTSQLSEIFKDTYSQLSKRHVSTPRPHLEGLATIKPCTSEDIIRQQWLEWIHLHSLERLLAACYILDAQQALLLARPTFTDVNFGLNLYVPASSTLWEAPVHTRWANLLRSGPAPLVDVFSLLDSIAQNDSHAKRCEPFQSALLTACHTSSVLTQRQEVDNGVYGPVSASHPTFEISNIALLEQALCPQANVLIAHHMVRIAAHSPTRALLAVSGESWVFSQRLSSEALIAATEFETLKNQLRSWSETLQQPTLWPTNTGTTKSDAHEALHRALNIIRLALDMDSCNLSFGTEMAIYYSALILWASAFRAVCKAGSAGLKFEDDKMAEFAVPRAKENARFFVALAEGDVRLTSDVCESVPPADRLDRLDRWRFGVGAVLTWGAWVLGGAGVRSSGTGELMEGAVRVLETLGRRGWVGEWF